MDRAARREYGHAELTVDDGALADLVVEAVAADRAVQVAVGRELPGGVHSEAQVRGRSGGVGGTIGTRLVGLHAVVVVGQVLGVAVQRQRGPEAQPAALEGARPGQRKFLPLVGGGCVRESFHRELSQRGGKDGVEAGVEGSLPRHALEVCAALAGVAGEAELPDGLQLEALAVHQHEAAAGASQVGATALVGHHGKQIRDRRLAAVGRFLEAQAHAQAPATVLLGEQAALDDRGVRVSPQRGRKGQDERDEQQGGAADPGGTAGPARRRGGSHGRRGVSHGIAPPRSRRNVTARPFSPDAAAPGFAPAAPGWRAGRAPAGEARSGTSPASARSSTGCCPPRARATGN